MIQKKGVRGDCRGIVVCVSFVLPQWPGARSQAVSAAAERLLQTAAWPIQPGCLSSKINAPVGAPGASGSLRESWGQWGTGAELKGRAPCQLPLQGQDWHRAQAQGGWSLHGASALTSILVPGGGYPQCPAPLSGCQENRSGLWDVSSTSLKESGIPRFDFFFFLDLLRTFSVM